MYVCLISHASIYFSLFFSPSLFPSLFPSLSPSLSFPPFLSLLSPSLSIPLEPDQPFFETIARIRQAVGGPEEEISESMNVTFVFLINAHHV